MGSSDTNASDISLVFHMQDFFKSPFHSESETTLEKCLFPFKWKFFIYVSFIFTLKKTKSLYFLRKHIPWTAIISAEQVLIPHTCRDFLGEPCSMLAKS